MLFTCTMDAISLFKKSWDARVKHVLKEVAAPLDNELVSAGLKVKHKKSGLLYTVSSVSPRDVVLKTPEDNDFIVSGKDFEEDYELG